jgi:hypothetical protein
LFVGPYCKLNAVSDSSMETSKPVLITPAYKRGLKLTPAESASTQETHKSVSFSSASVTSIANFNTFDSSLVFRSIFTSQHRQRSQHRPARINCEADRGFLSRSVSPVRRSARTTPSGKQWEDWEPDESDKSLPEPVRVDPPATMEVISPKEKPDPRKIMDYQARARVCHRAGRD